MMDFFAIYIRALPLILGLMTLIWIASVILRNAGIVDPFWGLGFTIATLFYFCYGEGDPTRRWVVLILATIWSLRLFIYLFKRNFGKEEDYRYRQFRKNYGENRYWWVSFFQVFMLQGVLLWLVSAPLLAAMHVGVERNLGILDLLAMLIWLIGFIFEAGSDYQLAKFKADPHNKGQLMTTGFRRYTRHPNYFGDAAVWWSFGLFSLAAGAWWPVLGTILMTFLLLKISGVAMLEKSLRNKPGFSEYQKGTSAFFPWIPSRPDNS
jgi:steroid 5-alpha reductase family enzyme